MNFAHLKIWTWEHGRRCLKGVVPVTIFFALILQGQVYVFTKLNSDYTPDLAVLLIPATHIVGFINVVLLLTANSSDKDLHFSMGHYYLRLPTDIRLLAATRIVLNCMTLAISGLVLTWITHHAFALVRISNEHFYPSLSLYTLIQSALLPTLFIYLFTQFSAWTFNIIGTIVSFFLGYNLLFGIWLYFEDFIPTARYLWIFQSHWAIGGFIIALLVTIRMSAISLARARCEEAILAGEPKLTLLKRFHAQFPSDPHQVNFPSPLPLLRNNGSKNDR